MSEPLPFIGAFLTGVAAYLVAYVDMALQLGWHIYHDILHAFGL